MRLDLVEGEFEFPALVVERDELRGGIGDGIKERGEDEVGTEAAVVDTHGAHAERRGQGAVRRAGRAAGREVDEVIAGAEALDDGGRERGAARFGADQPVTLAGGLGQRVEQRVGAKVAVEDDERAVGHRPPTAWPPG